MCCRRSTNLNILSPGGRNPSLSASMTMPSPVGGTKTSRANIIAAVVRAPSFELPGPVCIHIKSLGSNNSALLIRLGRLKYPLVEEKEPQSLLTIDKIAS